MTTDPMSPKFCERAAVRIKKTSSAASNVAQAKAKTARDGKISSITQARIEHGAAPNTGVPTLTAIFPRRDGREPHHLDLSFLLTFPNLQSMFTEAFIYWGATMSPRTRIGSRDSLRSYFFGYLSSDWSNMLHAEDIDDEVLAGFRNSLLDKSGGRSKALHPTTVNAAMSDLRALLSSLNTGAWSDVANRIAEKVPSGPKGADRKAEPKEVLGLEHLLAILKAAEDEVLAIEHRFANTRALLAEGHARLRDPCRTTNNTRVDYIDFAICLAAVDAAWPGVVPKLSVIRAANSILGGAIQNTHGLDKIESHLYPSNRDLVGFALLLAIATVFNPDTILNLNWQDVDLDKDQAGTPAIEIIGLKGRAGRDLVRLLDPNCAISSQLSLKRILVCLRDITARIRHDLSQEDANCLFVYVPRKKSHAKGFGFDGERRVVSRSSDLAWKNALTDFIKENSLPQFTLGQLRPSILDLVQFMDGSLEAARKVGNHGSPATTWTHYTSGGVRARYRERIGQVILLRERWLQTHGVIDPRRLTPGQDKGAATPGFTCLDPLDSQRPNQQPGKMCKDYGGCPSCPMAAAHPGDPVCVAYYTALELAIYRSQGTMSARTWVERWTPVLADLAALRGWIPSDVLKASRDISIQLPDVG